MSAGDDARLHNYCGEYGIVLTIYGIGEIAQQINNQYRSMAKDYLGLSIDTNQIMSLDEFVSQYDANKMAAPLSTVFQYREHEKEDIEVALKNNAVVVITGKSGVGKTRLVIETIRNIAKEDGHKLLCVKNNNLGLYEDLVSCTESPGKYIFFVDDANELAELNLIVAYTTKRNLGYDVKIIVTVRDYVKRNVISTISEYDSAKIIEVPPFKDEEIKGFLNDNLKILNDDYLNQIIRIAEGNPRIAYMAGTLAVEHQNLDSIKDATQLYEAYYSKYVNDSIGADKKLCYLAGILSVVNAVIINKMNVLSELVQASNMTLNEFKDKIYELSKMEFVEIQLDQVATLSDQCLSNYMLYYTFFENKLMLFSDVLKIGYKHFRSGVIHSLNTILNLFDNADTRKYCKQEVLKVWDYFSETHDKCLEDFISDFHVFRPEEAFLLVKSKIDKITEEPFEIDKVDYSKNNYFADNSILKILEGYQYSEYINFVLELLLQYCAKSNINLVEGYNWLENHYGISSKSTRYHYYTEQKVSSFILDSISNKNEFAKSIGLVWINYSLKFEFRPAEEGRGKALTLYKLELNDDIGLQKYRKSCWEALLILADDEISQPRIVSLIKKYAEALRGEPDYQIVKQDKTFIEKILGKVKSDDIRFLITLRNLLFNSKKIGVEYEEEWKRLDCPEWNLYSLLEDEFIYSEFEYEEYKAFREKRIHEYADKMKIEDIFDFVMNVNNLLPNDKTELECDTVNEGIERVIEGFNGNEKKNFAFLENLFGNNITIRPHTLLSNLHTAMGSKELYRYINSYEFRQKNDWQFAFFETLPEQNADIEIYEQFLLFLRCESDKEIRGNYRRLRVLDKFLTIEPNIYPVATEIIYQKRCYHEFIVKIYFELLFHAQVYKPEELIVLFSSDLPLLQDIYFFILKSGKFEDYTGTFLVAFLGLGDDWLKRYSDIFWENAKGSREYVHHRKWALWNTENYMKYYDYIFYHVPENDIYRWQVINGLSGVLVNENKQGIVVDRQQEWILHIIADNAKNDRISMLFEAISELGEDVRRLAFKSFLEWNDDYEMFEKITLEPNHFSGENSLIPALQNKVQFLESLLPYVNSVKFLKHRARIMEKIEYWERCIKTEEIEEICRNLYM